MLCSPVLWSGLTSCLSQTFVHSMTRLDIPISSHLLGGIFSYIFYSCVSSFSSNLRKFGNYQFAGLGGPSQSTRGSVSHNNRSPRSITSPF
ncbi:hypothetical protein GDO81_004063 [Engystomops pustulosus]|uniref:Secreted protein n=1 Tax=Engystomops pustulosus TaxID=76066 RepID=A0AAV6ZPP3_ENGPU|nr:hypothetical protein GDO81_004063 [Engystomops pustulosus]